ncbi:MAG: class I SAM-dependent methyltransferase [Rhizobiaceae bacterium]
MDSPLRSLSRLERTLFRLQAQHACLAWAFAEIADRSGPVLELGLGRGRTFEHMRSHLPEREIYVFGRGNWAYDEYQPDPDYLTLGEISETFPPFAARMQGRFVLANSDIEYFDETMSRKNAALAARLLPSVVAPGGIIMSDLMLDLPDFEAIPLSGKAPQTAYHLYRRPL